MADILDPPAEELYIEDGDGDGDDNEEDGDDSEPNDVTSKDCFSCEAAVVDNVESKEEGVG